jgi:ketosteroid isomerase-like protein
MSQETIELARRGYAALAAGDLAAVLELLDPEVEVEIYTERPDLPETRSFRGHAGFLENIGQLVDVFDELELTPLEFVEAGEDLVVVIRSTARGRASGVNVENRVVHRWSFRGGKATRFRVYSSREQALAARESD